MATEDGELQFPPRPIIHGVQDNTGIPRIGLDEPIEQPTVPLITTKDISLSPALESKIESLRASIMVCSLPDCPVCSPRKQRIDILKDQIKAELTTIPDLRKKITEQTDVDLALKAYIDFNEYPGRAVEVIEEYKKSHILRVK